MDIEYADKNESFEFEKYICFEKPEIWLIEALGLFSSAQILLEFSRQRLQESFSDEKKLRAIFSPELTTSLYSKPRVVRMLWGFGFENILKGIIIKNIKNENQTHYQVPLEEIKTHKLEKLFQKAKIELTENQIFYINIIEKCSVWMGRYPLPINSNGMYEQRKPMKSSEELLERTSLLIKKFLKGKIPRTFSESDILHSGIGDEEFTIINELINRTKEEFNKL